MRRFVLSLAVVSLSLSLAVAVRAGAFQLTSPEVAEGATLTPAQVFSGFGCSGQNVSPALNWSGAPADAKSFALTVYDPDAPTGSGWWHWIVFDLPVTVNSLPRGIGRVAKLPAGARQARNDFGSTDFGGACPPAGDKPHRYIFTIYALKVDHLEVPPDASSALVGFKINANQIGKASITARYGR
jgi:Raf kinase inhibitor-like YbhB/YbcL family protein